MRKNINAITVWFGEMFVAEKVFWWTVIIKFFINTSNTVSRICYSKCIMRGEYYREVVFLLLLIKVFYSHYIYHTRKVKICMLWYVNIINVSCLGLNYLEFRICYSKCIMRGEYYRDIIFVYICKDLEYFWLTLCVDAAARFVKNNHVGIVY